MIDRPESLKNANPDVLSCLANLSNDEVFTPPKIVNDILDMLPEKIWHDKNAKFLDPCTKSGVFLREIVARLIKGLEKEIPDLQKRVNHICKNQVFGIAITELTSSLSRRSVYCSRKANGDYSICTDFKNENGNIRFDKIKHTWNDGKCVFCGASQDIYDRENSLETYAYQFIHTKKPNEIFKMKFDVIIGNPPYQLSDGGNGRSAKPIYQHFIQQAKKLNPRYLTMIIPARWFAGGKGLDDFRKEMLNDDRIRKLVDYENSSDVFNGVDIAGGICYFLWDRDHKGLCEVTNYFDKKPITSIRKLNEYETFIRHEISLKIVNKISKYHGINAKYLDSVVSPRKPFGLPTNYPPILSNKTANTIPCWFIQKIGLKYASKDDIDDSLGYLNKYKLLIPRSPIAGQTDFSKPVGFYYDGNVRIAKPGECCTESYLVAYSSKSEEDVISFKTYLFTKTVRFLLLQTVVSQDVTRRKFCFIPDLGKYEGTYTDEILRKKWDITKDEWEFIDSKISNIAGDTND